jgi:exopolyphosphatase/guanosine-5'-triphosphate,3'-diphosphate pyrophosphatase
VSHSAHHKHSYYLIRNGELLGFAEAEIEVIANLARYHRKNAPKKKHESYSNLPSKKHRQLVNQLSAILRIAVTVDRRQIGAIQRVRCEYRRDVRELHLRLQASIPDDDCALELWSLDYEKGVFEAEYAVKLVATLESVAVVVS